MRLTQDYRRVTALFNTQAEQEVKYYEGYDKTDTTFTVGPFTYGVFFKIHGRTTEVEFKLIGINAVDEELTELMSRWSGERVSPQYARELKRRILLYRNIDELEIMGNYSIKVFSHVFNIVKDYVEIYDPGCIEFIAATAGRGSLYEKMARRAFPDASIKIRQFAAGPGVEITVCFY
jgi:hypothetical protein